ncbi:MAG: type II toxin-antitoxin system VapC family toxin [Acidobacteria bacterium]|nr:type II toxin-antitoxin system VapC family toxin [Acidobacteriota bacterium]
MVLYFDSAYVAQCYLSKADSQRVRELSTTADVIFSSGLAVAEMATVFHRHLREGRAGPGAIAQALRAFRTDAADGAWVFEPVSDQIIESATGTILGMPEGLLIRASDAIHLATARHLGLTEVWTNDRRMLEAAPAFGVTGRSV